MTAILVFGGSGFMGSHFIETFAKSNPDTRIITVNRGTNWNRLSVDSDRIQGLIDLQIKCDRDEVNAFSSCKGLLEADLASVKMIVDFSCYNAEMMKDSLEFCRLKFSNQLNQLLYVYISSDSVYEVCQRDDSVRAGRRILVEEDAVRPESQADRAKFAEMDSYGEGKLAAEEVLRNQRQVPFVSLRLPDVFGPRDHVALKEVGIWLRWWWYQLWCRLAWSRADSKVASPIQAVAPSLSDRPLSFVYAIDVAKAISEMFRRHLACSLPSTQLVYNFAWPKPFTLPYLLESIGKSLNLDVSKKIDSDEVQYFTFYPSVWQGRIDVSKFERDFPEFKFTDLDSVAIPETCQYFEEANRRQCHDENFAKMLKLQLLTDFVENKIVADAETFWEQVNAEFKVNISDDAH